MPLMTLTTTRLILNSTDLSAYCRKVEVTAEVDAKDVTTFGDAGWTVVLGGLKSGNLSADFLNAYAGGELDATLWPLFIAGNTVTFEVRPSSASASSTNPKFTGSTLITSYTPVSGAPGDEAALSVSWPTSGAIARATA